MRFIVKITSNVLPWALVCGSWIFKELNIDVIKYVPDGLLIPTPNVIYEFNVEDTAKLPELIFRLRNVLALSNTIGIVKWFTRLRVFTSNILTLTTVRDFVYSCSCGGFDAIFQEIPIKRDYDLNVNVVNNVQFDDSKPGYIMISKYDIDMLRNFNKDVVHGVILRDISLREVMQNIDKFREKLRGVLGKVPEIFIEVNEIDIDLLKELSSIIDGVLIRDILVNPKISVEVGSSNYIALCRKCKIEFRLGKLVKKCPYCSSRLLHILRDFEKERVEKLDVGLLLLGAISLYVLYQLGVTMKDIVEMFFKTLFLFNISA